MKWLYVLSFLFLALSACKETEEPTLSENNENPYWAFINNGELAHKLSFGARIIEFNSKLYGMWHDDTYEVLIKFGVYNPTSNTWTNFVTGDTEGLNKNNTDSATYPNMAVHNSKLYATWTETLSSNGVNQIRLVVYNGNDSSPSWSFVDGNAVTGLNYNSSRDARYPTLISFNSKLYAAWAEHNGANKMQIRVAVYNDNDSSPAWTFIDGGATPNINYNSSYGGITPQFLDFNAKLYLTWQEPNATTPFGGPHGPTHVKVYNGNDSSPSWTSVDGNTSSGISFDGSKASLDVKMVVFNGKIYAGWSEVGTGSTGSEITMTRMKVYNGNDSSPQWNAVEQGAYGLNVNTQTTEYLSDMTVHNSKLHISIISSIASRYPIWVKTYGGNDSSPTWDMLDNSDAPINCSNYVQGSGADLLSFNGKLFAMSSQQCPINSTLRLQVHD